MISFRSKTGNKILNYFFINQEAESYINELADILELDPGNTEKKLKEFEREGILKSEFRGNQRYFQLNHRFPLLEHYRQIFLKTIGIERRLHDMVEKISDIKRAYIFGSYARDAMDVQSDIDILIIGSYPAIELQKGLSVLQKEIGREINVVSLSESEYECKKAQHDPFLDHVLTERNIEIKP